MNRLARHAGLVTLVAALAAVACGGATDRPADGAVSATAPAGASATSGCRGLQAGDSVLSLEAGGQTRTVVVHVPSRLSGSTAPVPALIAFHGYSSGAAEFAVYSRLPAAADAAGFVIVVPQGLGAIPEWHFGNPAAVADGEAADETLFEALLARLAEAGCVDMSRVVLAGHSQGGGMASHLACLHADRIAGAAIVSGMLIAPPCRPARPVPIVQFHALDDPVLPYEGGKVDGTPSGFPAVLAAEDVATVWATRDGCTGEPADDPLTGGVTRRTWSGCAAPVTFYRLSAGGHGWPTADGPAHLDATAIVAAFVMGTSPG